MRDASVTENELIEEFVGFYRPFLPRIAGRMLALLALDGGEMESRELVNRLGVSAASVSSMGRRLIEFDMIDRRVSAETRRDLYSAKPDFWTMSWLDSQTRSEHLASWAARALAHVGYEQEHSTLIELRDFGAFLAGELPRLVDRYRETLRNPPAAPRP